MDNLCRICNNRDECTHLVIINHGLQILIDASIERNDEKGDVFRSITPIKVHVEYQKIYTLQSSILTDAKRKCLVYASAPTSVFSSPGKEDDQVFNFKNN